MVKTSKKILVRLPRPLGATALASEAHLSSESTTMAKFIDFMINHWLLSNGFICGIQYDIQGLARSLKVSVEDIRAHMRDRVMSSRVWDKESQEKILYGLIGELVGWTLEDRMRINAQIEILTRSQAGKYTPFISAELNKALKLGLESGTALQGVLGKLLGGGTTTNIFNLMQQNDNSVTNNYVTPAQVIELIHKEQGQLEKPEQAKLLETRYDLSSLPEVVATKQEGINISKEGAESKLNLESLKMVTDNFKAAMNSADEDHHAMRREIEQMVDPDAEDPELKLYDIDDYEEIKEDPEPFSSANYLNN